MREHFAKADIRSVLERLSQKWRLNEEVVDERFASGEEQESTGLSLDEGELYEGKERGQGTSYLRVGGEVA